MQIFGVMHPRDLLNLARTNKSFRAFLMSKDAQFLWKASFQNVDSLPKCPSYMNEPTYINLLFFNHCHVGFGSCFCSTTSHQPSELLEEQRASRLVSLLRTLLPDMSENYVSLRFALTLPMQKPTLLTCCPGLSTTYTAASYLKQSPRTPGSTPPGSAPSQTQVTCTLFSPPCPANVQLISRIPRLLHKPEIDEFEARWKGLKSGAARKDLVRAYKDKSKLIDEVHASYPECLIAR